ncbi:MAG: DUF177 domain-containing protein [Candidatus Omnitrophota bacterium]
MKIDINQLSSEENIFLETCSGSDLDIETDDIKSVSPLEIKAVVSKGLDNINILLRVKGKLKVACSRCLDNFFIDINKEFHSNYPIKQEEPIIDLNPEIRQEIILDHPLKLLCNKLCKGLCPKCGKNLNEGKCECK